MTFSSTFSAEYFNSQRGWVGFVSGALKRLREFDHMMDSREAAIPSAPPSQPTSPPEAARVTTDAAPQIPDPLRRADDLRRAVFNDLRNSGKWELPFSDLDEFAAGHPNGKLLLVVIDRIIVDRGIDRDHGLVGTFQISGGLGIPSALYDQMADVVAAARALQAERTSIQNWDEPGRLEAAMSAMSKAADEWIIKRAGAMAGSVDVDVGGAVPMARAYGLAEGGIEGAVRRASDPLVSANMLTEQEAEHVVNAVLERERRHHAKSRNRLDLDRLVGMESVYTDRLSDGRTWLMAEKARYEAFVEPDMIHGPDGAKAILERMLESLNSVINPGKALDVRGVNTVKEARIDQAFRLVLPADLSVVKRWQKAVDNAIKVLDAVGGGLCETPERLTETANALGEACKAFTLSPRHVGETLSKQVEAMRRLAAIGTATELHALDAFAELERRGKLNGGCVPLGVEKQSLLALRTQSHRGDSDKACRAMPTGQIALMGNRDLVAIVERALQPVMEVFTGGAFGTGAEPLATALKQCGLPFGSDSQKRQGLVR